jgi:hypothetical protein
MITNIDILPAMAIPAEGSSGFTAPLGGQYSFWIQELSPGTFPFGFDLELVSAVPEPGTFTMSLIGFATLVPVLLHRRRRAA